MTSVPGCPGPAACAWVNATLSPAPQSIHPLGGEVKYRSPMPGASASERTIAYYDSLADEYGRYADSFQTERLLGAFLGSVGKNHLVLDLGCGTGRDLASLGTRTSGGLGLDLSRGLLREARTRTTVPLICGDAVRLPFTANSFDRVISIASLHHLDSTGQCAALREIQRVLRSDGVAMVTLKTGHGLRIQRNEATGAERLFHLVGADTFVDRASRAGLHIAQLAESTDVRRGERQRWLACHLTVDV